MPRKIILALVLFLLLSACAPALTPSPTPVIGRGTPKGQGEGSYTACFVNLSTKCLRNLATFGATTAMQ
jgi:hypothetical protein